MNGCVNCSLIVDFIILPKTMEVASLNMEEGGAIAQQPVQLEFQNVCVDVKTKGGSVRILEDISGIFGP